jgi:hypothetical protein
MTGTIEAVNKEASDVISSKVPGTIDGDWQLWLARIQTREWGYGTDRDIEEGRLVGSYSVV